MRGVLHQLGQVHDGRHRVDEGIANNAAIPNPSKGEKCKQLKEHLDGINKKARTEALDYVEAHYNNNAKNINLKKLDENGFKSNSRKTSPTLPKLVHSSSDDSPESSSDDDDMKQGPRHISIHRLTPDLRMNAAN